MADDTEYGFSGIHLLVEDDGDITDEESAALVATARQLMIGRQVQLLDDWWTDDYDEIDRHIWELDGGVTIEGISNGPVNTLIIRVPSYSEEGEVEEEVFILYLESGYIDARPLIPGEPPIIVGAVYWPSLVQQRLSNSPCWVDSYQYNDICDARSYQSGGIDSLSLVEIPADSTIEEGKRRYAITRPWMGCTGKMRMLISSQLGRIPEKEANDENASDDPGHGTALLDSFDWDVYMVGGSANPNMIDQNNCAGLYTTTDYEYFVIRFQVGIGANTVLITQLTPVDEAVVLHEMIKAGDIESDQFDQAEAFLLAHMEYGDSITINSPNDDAIEGARVAYGWNFNWSGDEATLVTTEPVVAEDGDIEHHIQRRYQLSVSGDQLINDEGQPGISLTVTEKDSVECTPRPGRDNLWLPATDNSRRMEVHYWTSSPGGYAGGMIYDVEAPIYSYYRRDSSGVSSLTILTHEIIEGDSVEKEHGYDYVKGDVTTSTAGQLVLCGLGEAEEEGRTITSGDAGGFYLNSTDGNIFDAESDQGTGKEISASLSMELSGYEKTWSGGVPSSDIPQTARGCHGETYGNSLYGGVSSGGWHHRYVVDANSSASFYGDQYAIIPFESAEGVTIGVRRSATRSGDITDQADGRITQDTLTSGPNPLRGEFAAMTKVQFVGGWIWGGNPDTAGKIVLGPDDGPFTDWTAEIEERAIGRMLNVSTITSEATGSGTPSPEDIDFGRTQLIDPVLFGPFAYPYFDTPYYIVEGVLGDAYYTDDITQQFINEKISVTDDELNTDYFNIEYAAFAGWWSGWA